MSSRWCPSCGSEWWTDAVACRDCGASLVDERPPEPEPDPDDVPTATSHRLAELDLPEVDQAGRWRLTLVLETNGVVHRWRGTTLLLPAVAVELVEAELAGIDQLAPHGDEDDGVDDRELPPLYDPVAPMRLPRWTRVGGCYVDCFAFGLLYSAMTWIWGVDRVVWWDGSVHRSHGLTTPLLWTYAAIVLAIPTVAVVRWGRTLGMRATAIEVTDLDGARLTWPRSLARTVLALGWFVVNPILPLSVLSRDGRQLLQWVLLLWPIIVLGPALGPSGLGLHDRAVGSVVRRRERRPA